MGEIVPRECTPNALGMYEHGRKESFLEKDYKWVLEEGVERKDMAIHTAAANTAMVELMKENEEEVEGEDKESEEEGEEEGFSTEGLAPSSKQVAML